MAKIIRATIWSKCGRGGEVISDIREAIVETDADGAAVNDEGQLLGQGSEVVKLAGEYAVLGYRVVLESWEVTT